MPTQCPACRKKVSPEALACPYCPESFEVYEHAPQRRRIDPATWPPAAWLGVLALGSFFVWKVLSGIMSLGEEGDKNPLKRFLEVRTKVPETAKPTGAGLPAQSEASASEPAPAQPEELPIDGAALSVGEDSRVLASDWRLRGAVYDLVTLKALPKAALIFAAKRQRLEALTDESGSYQLKVPALEQGGYLVKIRRAGYSSSYLNPGTENVPQLSLEDRQAMARDLLNSGQGPYEVQAFGNTPLVTDFYLAPDFAER